MAGNPYKLWFTGPCFGECTDSEVVLALDIAKDLGANGVRTAAAPTWFADFGSDPDDDALRSYIDIAKARGLGLNILMYFHPPAGNSSWRGHLNGEAWDDSEDQRGVAPPNAFRPPPGENDLTGQKEIWNEIRRQLQLLIEAAIDEWDSATGLSFEFCNEPSCGGAFGMKVGDQYGSNDAGNIPVSTATMGVTRNIRRGEIDDYFHDICQYLLVDAGTTLDFGGYPVCSPTGAGHPYTVRQERQAQSMGYGPETYTYRDVFTHWGINVYPFLLSPDDPAATPLPNGNTGAIECRADVVRRAEQTMDLFKEHVTEVGEKPFIIQETGCNAERGAFLGGNESYVYQYGRPFYWQELGKYVAEVVRGLATLEVQRVGIFQLRNNNDSDDPFDIIRENSFGFLRIETEGNSKRYRPHLLTFAWSLGLFSYYDPPDFKAPDNEDWDVTGSSSEVIVSPV